MCITLLSCRFLISSYCRYYSDEEDSKAIVKPDVTSCDKWGGKDNQETCTHGQAMGKARREATSNGCCDLQND
jgi:hypothetical protein